MNEGVLRSCVDGKRDLAAAGDRIGVYEASGFRHLIRERAGEINWQREICGVGYGNRRCSRLAGRRDRRTRRVEREIFDANR